MQVGIDCWTTCIQGDAVALAQVLCRRKPSLQYVFECVLNGAQGQDDADDSMQLELWCEMNIRHTSLPCPLGVLEVHARGCGASQKDSTPGATETFTSGFISCRVATLTCATLRAPGIGILSRMTTSK